MNEIVIAQKLELNFIMDIHEKEFEKDTIENYLEVAERFGDIPAINEIPYNPLFLYASILYDWHGSLEYFKEDTSGYVDEDDLMQHVVDELDTLADDDFRLMNEYWATMTEEITLVLNFYHICFVDPIYNPFNGKTTFHLMNEPIIKVW